MEKLELSGSVLALLLVQVSISAAYHTCYDCARIPYPRECDHVIKCGNDSICYVEEVISDSGLVLFNQGCRSKTKCQQKHKRRSHTTSSEKSPADDVIAEDKGDLVVCEECCQGDYCNSRGCNSEPLVPISMRGPMCYRCHQQSTDDACDQLTLCDSTQSCFISPISSSMHVLYTSGCRPKYFCDNIQGLAIGRRDIPDCTGCCSTDYCNRNCSAVTNHATNQTASVSQPSSTSTLFTTSPRPSTTTSQTTAITTNQLHSSTTPSTTTATPSANIDRQLCQMLGYDFVDSGSFQSCFRLYSTKVRDWSGSRDKCKEDDGDLIVFNHIDEKRFFVNLTRNANRNDLVRFWVGASDLNRHHDWRWLDGNAVNKSYFHPREPNNDHGLEHCAALAQFEAAGAIALNDDVCSVVTNFICEITATSLTSTNTSSTHCRNHDYHYVPSIGMCFKIYKDIPKNQTEARTRCQGQQADLLILRNITIEYFFTHHLHFYDEDERLRYWLGAERVQGDKRNKYDAFRWYNDHVLSSGLEWFSGEPNNDGNNEDCLTFSYFNSKPIQFALNDDRCSKEHYYICEEKCPDVRYQYFPALDMCFKIYDEHVTWSEARDRCRQDHADLLEPDTQEKMAFMEAFLNKTAKTDIEEFWIGATDSNHDGTFEWMTSFKVVPTEFWHIGEPSSLSAGEHCASLNWFETDRRILMNDLKCENLLRFICEDIW